MTIVAIVAFVCVCILVVNVVHQRLRLSYICIQHSTPFLSLYLPHRYHNLRHTNHQHQHRRQRQLLGVRAKLELEVKDLSERVATDGDEQERLAEELKTLEANIAARKKDLDTEAGPAYEKARAR